MMRRTTIDPDILDEIQRLVDAQADFGLSATQCRRLEELVVSDPAVAEFYLQYVAQTDSLTRWAAAANEAVREDDDDGEELAPLRHGDETVTFRSGETMILPAVQAGDGPDDEPEPLDPPPTYPIIRDEPRPWWRTGVGITLMSAAAAVLLFMTGVLLVTKNAPAPSTLAQSPQTRNVVEQPVVAVAPTTAPVITQLPPAPPAPPPPPPPPLAGAVLADAIGASWIGHDPAGDDDVGVAPLRLKSGLAKLHFDSGAEIVIEGPAEVTADSRMGLTLSSGRITSRVPASASGFTVRTPTARIVDIGTEFGATVQSGQRTDIHVLRGEVAVAPAPPPTTATTEPAAAAAPASQIVRAGAAVAVDDAGEVHKHSIAPLSFVNVEEFDARAESAAPESSANARWLARTYALRRDPTLIAYYLFDPNEESIENLSASGMSRRGIPTGVFHDRGDKPMAPQTGPARLADRTAAMFDGSGRHVTLIGSEKELSFGPNGANPGPFTISFWMKVDPKKLGSHAALLAKGTGWSEQYAFDVYAGQLRFWVRQSRLAESAKAQVITAPPDGTWQNVIGVYSPNGGPGAAFIELYVNGKSRMRSPAPPRLLNETSPVVIGARTDADRRNGKPSIVPYGLALDGLIDEVAFFKTAKSADEIKALYEAGR